MKGSVEMGGIVSALNKNEEFTIRAQALPKKFQDPRIFSIPCTIDDCTFVNALLNLGASINVMPTSIYKSLNFGDLEPSRMTIQLANITGQPDLKASNANSSSPPPPMELKPLPSHLKYAYLDAEQQLPVIIANNLHREQKDKLLQVLREHKKAIRWKLSDLPRINPSIYMHRILMEEEAKPIRQQKRRMNLTILDVVKKEVTKLLAAGIIYPSQIVNG
ncbi:hypothetical protein CR513_03763, partial [Mucuna pruriens]